MTQSSMATLSVMWVFLFVFTVFTVIVGAGLMFYEEQLNLHGSAIKESGDHTQTLVAQASAMVIVFLFIGGAVLFLLGTLRYMEREREE